MMKRRILFIGSLSGFLLGYLVLSPFAMVVWNLAHQRLGIEHMERIVDSPLLSIKESFAPELFPWAITHASFGALIGAVIGFFLFQTMSSKEKEWRERSEVDRVTTHSRTLEEANRRLKELDKLKSDFLSSVSHELRTPLSSIKSATEILLKKERDRKTQEEFLSIIHEESIRLTSLINDLLDLSKIESGKVEWHWERVEVPEVVQASLQAVETLREKKKIDLALYLEGSLPTIYSDRNHLMQVLINLLDNAIKFTDAKGKITVTASKEKTPKEEVQFGVKDTGIGIATEDLSRIFDKFYQVRQTAHDKPKGTGLGLAICKEIVERHGGRIWAESTLGKGSCFFFVLPIKPKEVS